MQKADYIKLIQDRPWSEMEEYFNGQETLVIDRFCNLSVDPQPWIQFTVDNFDLAQQKWEYPKDHFSDNEKKWAEVNNVLGRNKENSFELNYGVNGDTNEKLKDLLGMDNIIKLNADPDTVLVRLLVKMPGHGVAWHQDANNAYKNLFPNVDHSKVRRYWFSIQDWKDGHAFQISKSVITHWKAGDVYEIPFGTGHASSNFGYSPQYTVSFTGLIKD